MGSREHLSNWEGPATVSTRERQKKQTVQESNSGAQCDEMREEGGSGAPKAKHEDNQDGKVDPATVM